jgi:glycosyltransferase involved in cell wall biosynthesis
MASGRAPAGRFDDTLVLTARKDFWASRESELFPHRVYVPVLYGHSTNLVNTLLMVLRTLVALVRSRPRILVFGSAPRIVPLFLVLKRLRLLRRTRLVVTNQVYFGPRLGRYAERVIVYSRYEAVLPSYVFAPLPVDTRACEAAQAHLEPRPYVFAGGGSARDFETLLDAVEGTGIPLVVVTHSPDTLAVDREPPRECRVLFKMPLERFLSYAKGAQLVVVPLRGVDTPHGHTTAAQALVLGKAVVATRSAALADYVTDGVEGILVEPGDVPGYREAIVRLATDDALRTACEAAARSRAAEFTYAAFARWLADLCDEVRAGTPPSAS